MSVALLVGLGLGLSCAPNVSPARSADAGGVRRARGERTKQPALAAGAQVVDHQVIAPDYDTSVRILYAEGRSEESAGRCHGALAKYRRVVELDPDSEVGVRSSYRLAICEEDVGHHLAASREFERLARRHAQHELARDALLRAVRLRVFLERWVEGATLARVFLERHADANHRERIVCLSALALADIASGDDESASLHVELGRRIVEDNGLDQAGAIPRDLAQLYYALGEIRRLRGERVDFRPVPTEFGPVLERRCQLLLDAQGAYSDTMRAYDAHWSAMAGYRVGELYARLHRDLMAIPPPAKTRQPDRTLLFEGAMRLRYSILLKKGLSMIEHTLAMAQRTGESSHWVERAAESKIQLERAMAVEQAAIDRLPYSRAQLQAALDELIAGQP